jgi:hypothetical protein
LYSLPKPPLTMLEAKLSAIARASTAHAESVGVYSSATSGGVRDATRSAMRSQCCERPVIRPSSSTPRSVIIVTHEAGSPTAFVVKTATSANAITVALATGNPNLRDNPS